VSHARNEAVKQSNASLILPLDCDDTLKLGAVERLVSAWNGVPLYPDVAKFGDENVEHYVIMEWDCSHLYNFVGYTSVNVLHSKEQWKAIGGWDENLDFYEDGEYNARLFGNYCARRIPEPLVNYRIHAGQRTKKYGGLSKMYAKKILAMVRRYDFMCAGCGKKRSNNMTVKSGTNRMSAVQISGQRGENIMVDNANLPLQFEGKVLARYVGGKGKGKHYYQGPGSKTYYRNVQYNDLVYADPRDVGSEGTSKFVAVQRMQQKPISQAVPMKTPVAVPFVETPRTESVPAIKEPEIRTPKVDVVKEPISEGDEGFAFRDIGKFSLKEIKEFDISCEDAKELVGYEIKSSKRPAVLKYLKSLCSK